MGYPIHSDAIKKVIVQDGVKNIGMHAFKDCKKLELVTIPNTVTKINGSPFAENIALKTVTIGNDVTAINANSFKDCTGLSLITSNPTTAPTIQSNTFTFNAIKNIPVKVPCGSYLLNVYTDKGVVVSKIVKE